MMRMGLLMIAAFVFFAAHADDNTNSTGTSTKKKKPTVLTEDMKAQSTNPGADIDEEITNNRLRAESGSKSRWSISNYLTYYGGTVNQPFAQNRPNITNGTGNTAVSALQEQVAGKYNIDKANSISAGVGARWITPLNSLDHVPANYSGNKTDIYDPYLKYQYIYKKIGVQNVASVTATDTTQNNLVRLGFVGNVNFQQDSTYEIGHSGLSVGALFNADFAAFDNNNPAYLSDQSDYSGGIYPTLEYVINSRLNVRTIIGMWVYEHLRSEPRAMAYMKDDIYQSLGVGLSVTRDFFLYPNVQFIPEHIQMDRTNVGLTAYVNLF